MQPGHKLINYVQSLVIIYKENVFAFHQIYGLMFLMRVTCFAVRFSISWWPILAVHDPLVVVSRPHASTTEFVMDNVNMIYY